MIKIEFNDTTLHVPQSWSEIEFGHYEQFSRMDISSPADHVRYVATICRTTYDELMQCPSELFDKIVSELDFVFRGTVDPSPTTTIDSVNYYVSYGDKLTLGEWVDVEAVLEGENPHYLSDTLGILCRPAGEEYDADRSKERADLFRAQPCDKMLPLLAFFLQRKKQFDEISNRYSEAVALAEQFVRDTDHLVKSGGGTKRLPILQRIKYIFLMRSLKRQLSKFSASCSIR